ncbi:MAG: histidine--tRNA ligase [Deltaproteobacteria bacterium]|nr:histidine--tRNA ligase [Deltaproteobacteria bacterium]
MANESRESGMSKTSKVCQSVTGMNDVLPAEAPRWRALEAAFRAACARYGFGEVRTPVCEYTELFTRGIGEETDVVAKEMYSFEDRGGHSLTLRPEGTASAVRAYLEHTVGNTEPVARWYYVGPMFRGERPAKGRYRQFHQVGAEVYGDGSAAVDAELIDLAYGFVQSLGISQCKVRLNSLGSGDTKRRYAAALQAYYTPLRDKLSEDSQRRLTVNPLRILDSKSPEDVALRGGAPHLLAVLTDEDRQHFDKVCAILTRLGTPFEVDPTIIRGLDYYSRTIFEISETSGRLGAQDALGGGGRYDTLISDLGGKPTPAVGFAFGIERLLLAASDEALRADSAPVCAVLAVDRTDADLVHAEALAIAKELRSQGLSVVVDTRFGKLDKQFRHAERAGAVAAVIVGKQEIDEQTVKLKDLVARQERSVGRDVLAENVRALLQASRSGSPTE